MVIDFHVVVWGMKMAESLGTFADLANRLGTSEHRAEANARRGYLAEAIGFGRIWCVNPETLEGWVEDNGIEPR